MRGVAWVSSWDSVGVRPCGGADVRPRRHVRAGTLDGGPSVWGPGARECGAARLGTGVNRTAEGAVKGY
ncbi:hypothetical protein GCM10018781_63370 [Kitasatospora indigofera]|uniref:Uncharacterized protein n=1 Tax=Kitasatospora indigofera TaxID=67307 RepID=A0A919L278_9ACTN|nr:hypothetical protein GCM10018781_63370 [Kitasatospora indigofera]